MARIGFLDTISPLGTPHQRLFLRALLDLGYVEGQDLAIEYRWAEEQDERLPEFAAELVGLNVDVILAANSAAAVAARSATTALPIVFVVASDPVASGLVASIGRPGGNATGLSSLIAELADKRLELLKEAAPHASRVAVLAHTPDSLAQRHWGATHVAAQILGLDPRRYDAASAEELEGAFAAMTADGADAIVVLPSTFLTRNRARIVNLAQKTGRPAMYEGRQFTAAGGFMSYGPEQNELFKRAATYVDKILKGAKPADLPVEQPTRFDFVINKKTADALGLTIPRSVLMQATEVIE